ncbi:hypothetical protein [Variovorax sp. Root434]|uniref:hypothetical protein n=1 Tax=Variovorax sp. Root434 TaxID=1736536 RepID=UPI0006FEA2E8|nr:hypothetical protein [Variovorax sp. Root434]KQX30192.1 hypothetical protein ASD05_08855 [Variovorax sp. Root434]
MDLLALLDHLFNFVAPAAFLALVLALAGRFLGGGRAGVPRWWVQWALTFAVGVGVSVIGLVVFGRDGMMATYAALVAACGTVQWLAMRGWRR